MVNPNDKIYRQQLDIALDLMDTIWFVALDARWTDVRHSGNPAVYWKVMSGGLSAVDTIDAQKGIASLMEELALEHMYRNL